MVKVVSNNVGNNPVARALARKQLSDALRDQRIHLFLMQKGDDCRELMMGLWYTLKLIYTAAEAYKKVGVAGSTARIIKGGISACEQMAESKTGWDPINAVPISVALDGAEVLNKQIPPKFVMRAFLHLNNGVKP